MNNAQGARNAGIQTTGQLPSATKGSPCHASWKGPGTEVAEDQMAVPSMAMPNTFQVVKAHFPNHPRHAPKAMMGAATAANPSWFVPWNVTCIGAIPSRYKNQRPNSTSMRNDSNATSHQTGIAASIVLKVWVRPSQIRDITKVIGSNGILGGLDDQSVNHPLFARNAVKASHAIATLAVPVPSATALFEVNPARRAAAQTPREIVATAQVTALTRKKVLFSMCMGASSVKGR